ncbi:ATP-binding protein [Clostridium tyrobutyricum]|uniref:ATP-binding protein n=1 Tax=Clostridium tyrobutyricum TaxID=1519 RepID=UPI0020CC029E|nr:ATP-binding protein [Clostridium tyrobutyricum]
MQVLDRILSQVRMTSQGSEDKPVVYKCSACQDTGWIQTDDGYKRCQCYKKEQVLRLWKNFGVNPAKVKTLNDYKPYDNPTKEAKNKAIAYIQDFENIRNTEKNSFGLFGQPGAGKSHIVIAIGAALLKKENPVQVIYMPYLEAMRELKSNVNDDEYYLRLLGRYQRAKVLIIDDLFKDKVKNGQLIKDRYGNKACLNEADIKHIMPIINYRYLNHLPIIISTECKPDVLMDLDEALAGRILESCGDNITIFKGQQYNYRMRNFSKK